MLIGIKSIPPPLTSISAPLITEKISGRGGAIFFTSIPKLIFADKDFEKYLAKETSEAFRVLGISKRVPCPDFTKLKKLKPTKQKQKLPTEKLLVEGCLLGLMVLRLKS